MSDYTKDDPRNLNAGYERKQPRHRRNSEIKTAAGFQRHGIIPESPYEAPDFYPSDAQDYLEALSRCGTVTGACTVAGVSSNKPSRFRKQLEGFYEEEDIAKECFTDVLEADLFKCGLGFHSDVRGMSRVKALEKAIKANRPEKYNDSVDVNVDAEVTWLDLIKEHAKSSKDEDSDTIES